MSWKDNWGETFDQAPAWVIAFAEFLTLPNDARPDDCVTQKQFAEKWTINRSQLAMVQGEPEFKRLLLSMADANGITEAHRRAVMENLFRRAAYEGDPRAIKLFMEISGQFIPAAPIQINVAELGDADVDRLLAEKLGLPVDSILTVPKELHS